MDNNEDSENVKIIQEPLTAQGRKIQFAVPPYGSCVFTTQKMTSGMALEPTPQSPRVRKKSPSADSPL